MDPEAEITVTCGGATAGVQCAMRALLDPGDEVIIMGPPTYENYRANALVVGAVPRFVSWQKTIKPDGKINWELDLEALSRSFNNKTRLIVVNNPNNPTGKVFSKEELTAISDLCMKWDAAAIADDIYRHMTYEQKQYHSLADISGMRERTVTIDCVSKQFALPGWRVGWAIAPAQITDAIRKVHSFINICAPHAEQYGVIAGLENAISTDYYSKMAEDYQRRRDFFVDALSEVGLPVEKPDGSYYLLCNTASIKTPPEIQSDSDFVSWLMNTAQVAGVPGNAFYGNSSEWTHLIRFSFGRGMDVLEKAAVQLQKLKSAL